jgi:hypothetical protein
MTLLELRERGRRRAEQLWIRMWRRLPLGAQLRTRVEALIPKSVAPSPYSQPPDEFERPPPRARFSLARADERAIGWRPFEAAPLPTTLPTIVALHFSPQSDDWTNVARARPQLEGHAQPRLPAFGYYDPADPSMLARQASCARAYGISVFAFVVGAGPRRAADAYLATPALTLPFCLVWTKETDDDAFVALLRRAIADARYWKLRDRLVVIASSTPTAKQVAAWRTAGALFVVVRADTLPPHCDALLSSALSESTPVPSLPELLNPAFRGLVSDYRTRSPHALPAGALPLVELGHDDEPTRPGFGTMEAHAAPRIFADKLAAVIARTKEPIFVDAFNDWAHGAVLEPDARLGHAYLASLRTSLAPRAPAALPCVVLHAYYVELLEEIALALRASGLRVRLIVTTPVEREAAVRQRLAELGLAAEVEAHENRGRDILPFLRVANRLVDEGVELVLKLHTKSSGHRLDGARWRAELIGRLLDHDRATKIVDAFARDPRLGCVAPEGHYLPLSAYWGWNEDNVRYLCTRLGIAAPDIARDYFPAGSMFWIRAAALRPLLDAHLGEWEFPAEGGYVDGTMAHAVERALGLTVQGAGLVTRTAAAVCGIAFDDETGYAYAEATGPDIR